MVATILNLQVELMWLFIAGIVADPLLGKKLYRKSTIINYLKKKNVNVVLDL